MFAVGYRRMSGPGDSTQVSLDRQTREIENYCKREKLTLLRIYQDIESGENMHNRLGFQQALSAIYSGRARVLITYRQNRMSRSLLDSEELRREFTKLKAQFRFVDSNINVNDKYGKRMFQMQSMVDEWDREDISDKLYQGRKEAWNQGKHGCGAIPFGWRKVGKELQPSPEEQACLMRIKDLWVKGLSLFQVADQLNAEGFTTRRGKAWKFQHVWHLIKYESKILSVVLSESRFT